MNFLEKILEIKKEEVSLLKKNISLFEKKNEGDAARDIISLSSSLLERGTKGIIAEFKRKSPSKGILNGKSDIPDVVAGYQKAGATGISILTDQKYFGGSTDDLRRARVFTSLPILRKDFIIDEIQIHEAKFAGADAVLIIAALLSNEEILNLSAAARRNGLEVLLEIHSPEDLDKINEHINIIGVNNRNLKTLEVDINTSFKLAEKIPKSFLKISESGISSPNIIRELESAGFNGFLIGERFMAQPDPAWALKDFLDKL